VNPPKPPAPPPAPRLPYAKPAIAWEEQLVGAPNLIAACAKMAGESAACNAANKS
jgi:hypothetical protein